MKSFLEYVADDIIRKHGTDLARTVVVFPNKRASLFLNEYLARRAEKPIWSPAYITISELFRQLSPLQTADPIKLIGDLHRSFCQATGSDETLDKFYGWGQLLLSDFDDIDKNMADADKVFANLRDIHELDDLSYLTDEQRELLRQFFSNFTEEHESELKQRFIRLWSHFADIYHDFNRRLLEQGLCYEGALYRQVAEKLADSTQAAALPADRYLFIGFNLLQKVEQQLFSHLQRAGKACFYWDFDSYYMQHHEAGRYIKEYLRHFPNELDTKAEDVYNNFRTGKQVTYISAPTEHIQARYVSTWLRERPEGQHGRRLDDGRRTAIVMCDERLLPTVIHCLPGEVEKVNVTTGYPLAQTPVASFIKLYFDVLLGGRSPRLMRLFRRHPYYKYIGDEVPRDGSDGQGILRLLACMLRRIAQNSQDDTKDPLFQESLFRAYTLVNRLDGLIESGDLRVTDITLQRLTGQLVQQTTIPFHGEPAEGIQVMGVLETRNLDFDHVLLLSCNEGNMPRGVNDSSFIPHSIRQAYELTTVENKVGIYAYYFHRLLQRAKDVTILWNNSTEDGQRGEMSRFMLQMLVESNFDITQRTLQAGRSVTRWKLEPVRKTSRVMNILAAQFCALLSPTAVNRYMRCQLQFYYRYIADIEEPDVPDDEQELDNRIFGNIFHNAADIIYKQLPNAVSRQVLDHVLKDKAVIARAVDEAFHLELPHAPMGGLHLINREVIIRYLRQLIEIDRRLAPFTILGLECDVQSPLVIPASMLSSDGKEPEKELTLNIGGRIDRLDQMSDGRIRVVDYKTGSRRIKPLADVEAIFAPEQIHNHSDYYLQTFVYADIVRRHGIMTAEGNTAARGLPVSPALLFIQHAAAEEYDPTLCFGKERITDIADYSPRFRELLVQKVGEMFSSAIPFAPTNDLRTCRSCPYLQMCRR